MQDVIEDFFSQVAQENVTTVLVVDKDALCRNLAWKFLMRAGYVVFEAADGWEALQISRAYPGIIDLLVRESRMATDRQHHLIRILTCERRNIKTVIMQDPSTRNVDVSTRVHGVIQKPFTLDSLLSALSAVR